MTTVNLTDTEALSSKVVEILAEASTRILEETGLEIKGVDLRGTDATFGRVKVEVKEVDDQFNVSISRKEAKKLANKFFDKSGQVVSNIYQPQPSVNKQAVVTDETVTTEAEAE